MKDNAVTRLNELFSKIGGWSLAYRWPVFVFSIALLIGCAMLAGSVRMNNSFDAYFDVSDAGYAAYLQYRDDFGSDEIAYVLYDARHLEHGAFDYGLMKQTAELIKELEASLPFVKEVNGIANSEVIVPTVDGIDIIKLTDDFPASQRALLEFSDRYMKKNMFIGGYVSSDRQFGAIRIDMDKSSIDPVDEIRLDPEGGDGLENVYPQVTDAALFEILHQEKYQDIKFIVSGDVPLNASYNRIAMNDMALSTLASLVLIGAVLLFFLRSVIGVVGPLSVVLLSVLVTVGFISLMEWDIDMMFAMVPTLLIAIGTAHAVHIISEFRIYYARYQDRSKAIKQTLHLVGAPCLLTSVTTAAGFMALSISPIKTIAHMAIYTSLSVLAAFFLSITLLTFFLSFGKPQPIETISKENSNPRLTRLLESIAQLAVGYPKVIVVISAGFFVMAGFGMAKVKVDSNFLTDFSEGVEVRQATEFIDNTMGGMGSVIYLFESPEYEGIKNPLVLKEIERFQAFVDEQAPLVQKTYTIVDLIKDINQSFHGGDPAYYTIPESRELIAQYLLFYELSGGSEINEFVSTDYQRASLEIRTQLANSSEIAALKSKMDQYQAENPLQYASNQFTGIGSLWIKLMDYISISQIQGVLLAFGVIAMLMCLLFRSVKIGLISMIPNVAPSVFIVGLIGWCGVNLDYTKLIIAPIAIGIAVDDTIHMLSRIQHEFSLRQRYNEAIIAAMRDVGKALFITSVVLVCGFSANSFSVMDSSFWFGMLLTITIVVALVADFFVLPALIVLLKPFGAEKAEAEVALA